jgi:hypothetical protein
MQTKEGDIIYIFRGAKVPFILRKVGEQSSYRFVGEGYLQGYMHGQLEKLSSYK